MGMINLRWTISLKCPQFMHFWPDYAVFLHLGLLQASQNHLFLKLMCVIHTSKSEQTGSKLLLYITSASISFTKRLKRPSCCLLSSRCSEIGSQSSLATLPSKRLKRCPSARQISDLKMELKESVSRQLWSLKCLRTIVLSTHMGLIYRSLFQMTTSIDLRVSGSPTSRLFLKIVLSPFQILRSSPTSSRTSVRVLILSKSFSEMISCRVDSELLALGMQLISLTGMKELSLLKMRLYLEQSFLLVWLQFSSRICPREMRQMRLRWMRSWQSLALSPNMTPSIFIPALSTIVILKILVNFPLLLLNSRYDFSMTLTTISHLPWKPMQRSLIFSNCFSSSSMISSASCESLMGSTGLRPLESFFSVLYSTGGCLYAASFLMDGSANYQILVVGAIF